MESFGASPCETALQIRNRHKECVLTGQLLPENSTCVIDSVIRHPHPARTLTKQSTTLTKQNITRQNIAITKQNGGDRLFHSEHHLSAAAEKL